MSAFANEHNLRAVVGEDDKKIADAVATLAGWKRKECGCCWQSPPGIQPVSHYNFLSDMNAIRDLILAQPEDVQRKTQYIAWSKVVLKSKLILTLSARDWCEALLTANK